MITAGVQDATPLLPTFLLIVNAAIVCLTIVLALFDKFLEMLAIHSMPLADENIAVVINVYLGMPGQAVITGVNLVRLSGLVKGR